MYAIWPGMTDEDSINEICQLGKFSYYKKDLGNSQFTQTCTFYKLQGFGILEEMIKRDREDILNATKIVSNRGKIYTVEKFLTSLEMVTVK